jgi:hypothetical protein
MRSFLFVLGLSLAACSAAPNDEAQTTEATNDELLACGWLNGGGCSFLPSGNWRTPEFWGDVYLAKYASQRHAFNTNIEPGPTPLAQPRAVLMITGVTIKAEWFDGIVARLKRDGFVPYVYEPPALLSGDLFKNAAALDAIVDNVRKQSGQQKIDILAECTGGVIARHYIQSLGGDQKIDHMVTFVSPQHGIGMAPLVHMIAGWPALHDLSPGSAFLHAVNDVPLPKDVKFTSIYTCTDEYIQPWTSSVIPGATNIGLSCTKGFTGHFQTMYDPEIYMIMHDALIAE